MSMAINSTNTSFSNRNVSNNNYRSASKAQAQISSGTRLYTAANDAAGLAIYEKMGSLLNGLKQGINNTVDMMNLVTTAEGGLTAATGNLQRIRELSLQAANGTMSNHDKEIIQNEVNQLMQGVGDVSSQTEFNGIKLLNGTFVNKNTASSPNGTGREITIGDNSLSALGVTGYDVTRNTDIARIDKAINTVVDRRANLGATQTALGHTINANSIAELNLAASRSRLADTNIAKASTALGMSKVARQYQTFMQRNNMSQAKNEISLLI